ncbi:MAG TPA: toprim domain-containing protein, partial [Gemmata sp.]|nr:toprim domain-containing protein [Gemmata sp.]
VVATMGTALNARHVAQLRRYVPRVVLVYDADAGGVSGVDRALEIFVSQDVELAVAMLPEGLDPCDLLTRPEGSQTFKQLLTSATDALDFKLNRLLETDAAGTVEGTRRVVDDVLGIMAAAPPLASKSAQVKQELIVTRLAHRLGLRQETVWARLGELRNERRKRDVLAIQKGIAEPAPLPGGTRVVRTHDAPRTKTDPTLAAELQLLELLLAHPGFVSQAAGAVDPEQITHSGIRRILTELYSAHMAGMVPDIDVLRERLTDRPDLFEAAAQRQLIGQSMREPEQWFGRILKRFDDMKADVERKQVKDRLASANPDEAVELLRRLQKTQKTPG